MKRIVFSLPLIILFIWGCSRNPQAIDRYFLGKSDHWMGVYRVIGSNLNHQATDKLIYIGSDQDSVKMVKYYLQVNEEDIKDEELFPKNGGFIQHQSSGNNDLIPENNTLEVTVEWNGQVEKFLLKPSAPLPL